MIDEKKLFEESLKGREMSRSPYSKFKVGAAVLLKNGNYIHGANIENSAFGLCMCAERNAMFGAYCQGFKKEDIEAIGIIADTKSPVSPCGSCRQVMSELLELDTPVYMFNLKGDSKIVKVKELLPFAFAEGDF